MDLGPRISEASASAAFAAIPVVDVVDEDSRARLFRIGKTILVSFGVAEKRTGALIGQWLKKRSDPDGLLAAIQFAREQNVAEPVAYISAVLNGGSNGKGHSETLEQRCQRLAAAAREREVAAGITREDDYFRGD